MPIPSFRLLDEENALWPEIEELAGQTLAQARIVYRELGAGMFEQIYKDAMMIALADAGLNPERDVPVRATFRGRDLGRARLVDIVVDRQVAVELKSVAQLHPIFETQLLTYMRLGKYHLGFVINFGGSTLRGNIRRKAISAF